MADFLVAGGPPRGEPRGKGLDFQLSKKEKKEKGGRPANPERYSVTVEGDNGPEVVYIGTDLPKATAIADDYEHRCLGVTIRNLITQEPVRRFQRVARTAGGR